MIIKCFQVPLILCLFYVSSVSAATYQPWSENVFTHINKEYGVQAEKRMRLLHDFILENQEKSDKEKLRLVNDIMNKLPWIADEQHWKSADYWATPLETLTTFGGDCEDIAIAKLIVLRHLGIPREKLRLVYVRVKETGENHMVLAYVERIDLPREKRGKYSWILDNINEKVLSFPERKDLIAIYAADGDGNVVVFKDSDEGPSILGVRENTKVKKLDEIKRKIQENMAEYEKLNDGRPLHPY